ncbi:MAG TPA: lysylphosphatidylglycerol synthase transmembrane domain-containing protein [Solirubrobacteraceae bacterium]|nr:lysylphosphatidylglycerol synthase transmembrane domain-containing protein [Solirubrobacteraceae bacterium]
MTSTADHSAREPGDGDRFGPLGRLALLAAGFALAVTLVITLPGVDEVRDRFAAARPGWIAVAAACSLGSMLGFVRALWAAFDRLMPWRRAVVLGFAEQAANVLVPAGGVGGPALGTVVMRRAGVPGRLAAERHAVLFLATSFVSFAALALAGVLVAAGVLGGGPPLALTLGPAAGAFTVLGVAALSARSAPPSRPGPGRVRQAVWRGRRFVHDGLSATWRLLHRGDRLLIAGAIGYYAFDVGALRASFAAVGGHAPPLGVFVLAYTLGHTGALLPTPGGIGGTEGGLIGMFVAYGTPIGVATAAVLAYRVFQLGLPAILGGACLLRLRRYEAGDLAVAPSTAEAPPLPAPATAPHWALTARLAAARRGR